MKSYDNIRTQGREAYEQQLQESTAMTLDEALVILGKGKRYGQAVILAGGAGSGKGFAVTNLMQGDQYKVINPDDFKDLLLKMRDKKVKPQSEKMAGVLKGLVGLDMLNPADTSTLHVLVKGLDLMQKKIALLFAGKGAKGSKLLPNVMFDVTMKDRETLFGDASEEGILTQLKDAGYQPNDIHIVWILTDYKIAMQQNMTRGRVVNSKIVLQSHAGASKTMQEVVFKGYSKMGINGDVVVIMGGANGGSVTYGKGSEVKDSHGNVHILNRDLRVPVFAKINYFRVKKAGEARIDNEAIEKIKQYIGKLAPPPSLDFETKPELAARFVAGAEKRTVDILRKKGQLNPKVAKYLGYDP